MHSSSRMAKIQNTDKTKCWQGCGEQELSISEVEMQNDTATLEDKFGILIKLKIFLILPCNSTLCSLEFMQGVENTFTKT